jgi:Ca-activated chloride channel family protein
MIRCCLVSLLAAAVTLSSAQGQEDHPYALKVDVELVQLPVSVLDKHGLPVRGLRREHFIVYEDKVLQDISLFKQEDIPLSVGLVIDASSSMIDKLERLSAAAMTFVRESNPEDETSIVSFGTDVYVEQDFTQNLRDLRRALMGIHPNGDTALYDAVLLSAQHLQQNGSREKKVLLVVSDGEDNKSKYHLKDVLKAARELKVIVYTVGLLSSDFSPYGTYGDTGKKALKELAEGTGGASFFPKNLNEVEQVCIRIARDLRNQYTVGYRPSNRNLDGSWRKVSVRINPPKDTPSLKIRTKQGYYAPAMKSEPVEKLTIK